MLEDGSVAVHGPIAAHQRVQIGIIERALDEMKGVAVERMGKGRKLPTAYVPREKQDALALRRGAIKIFETVVDHHLVDVLGGVARKETDLGELAAQRSKHRADYLSPLSNAFLGKSQRQVTHSHPAQLAMKLVERLSDCETYGTSQGARKCADGFHRTPDERVFQSKAHRGTGDRITA